MGRVAARRFSAKFLVNLHNRIMDRIAHPPAIGFHKPRRLWFRPLAIAAAALMLATFMLLHHTQPSPTNTGGPIARGTLPSVPNISNPVRALETPIVPEWTTARYAYLDRDGEKLLGYVGRQLDFMPRKQQ